MGLTCLACKQRHFPSLSAMSSHYAESHLWCIICKTTFPDHQALDAHRDSSPFNCPVCFRCFTSAVGLADHVKSSRVHLKGDPALMRGRGVLGSGPFFGCGVCVWEGQVLHALVHHRRVVHNSQERVEVVEGKWDDGVEVIDAGGAEGGCKNQGPDAPGACTSTHSDPSQPPPSTKRKKKKRAYDVPESGSHAVQTQHATEEPSNIKHEPPTASISTHPPPPPKKRTQDTSTGDGGVVADRNETDGPQVDMRGTGVQNQSADGQVSARSKRKKGNGRADDDCMAGASGESKGSEPSRTNEKDAPSPISESSTAESSTQPPTSKRKKKKKDRVRDVGGVNGEDKARSDADVAGDHGEMGSSRTIWKEAMTPSTDKHTSPTTSKQRKQKDRSSQSAIPPASPTILNEPDAGSLAPSARISLIPVLPVNGEDASVQCTSEHQPTSRKPKRKKKRDKSSGETEPATTPVAVVKSPTANPPTPAPLATAPPPRPTVTPRDIADASTFLTRVSHRLRAHPENYAQLMQLLTTPSRMTDVQGVYRQMKQLLGCAPELLGELERFVGAVMVPGSGTAVAGAVGESDGTSAGIGSLEAAGEAMLETSGSVSSSTVDGPGTAPSNPSSSGGLQSVTTLANASQVDTPTQNARKKKKTLQAAPEPRPAATPADTATTPAEAPRVRHEETSTQAEPSSSSTCPDVNASASQADVRLPPSSALKRTVGHDRATEPATTPVVAGSETVGVIATNPGVLKETAPAHKSQGAMDVDGDVDATRVEDGASCPNARRRKRTETAEELGATPATTIPGAQVAPETTTWRPDTVLSITSPVAVTAPTESPVEADTSTPEPTTTCRNEPVPSPAPTTAVSATISAADGSQIPNGIRPVSMDPSLSSTSRPLLAVHAEESQGQAAPSTSSAEKGQGEAQDDLTSRPVSNTPSDELPAPNGQARSTDESAQLRSSQPAAAANTSVSVDTGAFISDVRKRLVASRNNSASTTASESAARRALSANTSCVPDGKVPARTDAPSKGSRAITANADVPQGPGLNTPNARKRKIPITEIFAMISPSKKAHTENKSVHPLTPPATSPSQPKTLSGPFFCTSCDSPIDTFGDLVTHLLHICTYTVGSQLTEAQGYACQSCNKRFSQPWGFETHLLQEPTHMRAVNPPSKALGAQTVAASRSSEDTLAGDDEPEIICLTSPPRTPTPAKRKQSLALPVSPMASSSVPSSLTDLIGTEDCTIYCRQCDLDLPAVEDLVDHFSDDLHRDDTIYCYSCDETFGKPHLLWPHIFTSLRHENAPPGTKAEFSSTQYRWDALASGQRCSGEAPIEIIGPGKTRKRRLTFQVVKPRVQAKVEDEDWGIFD